MWGFVLLSEGGAVGIACSDGGTVWKICIVRKNDQKRVNASHVESVHVKRFMKKAGFLFQN